MSENPIITSIEAVEAVKPLGRLWGRFQANAVGATVASEDVAPSSWALTHEHFLAVASQLKTQPLFGHEFDHGNDFFHRFMRAAGDQYFSTDLHNILVRDARHGINRPPFSKFLTPALIQRLLANRLESSTKLIDQMGTEAQTAISSLSVRSQRLRSRKLEARVDTTLKPAAKRKAGSVKLRNTSSGTLKDKLLESGGIWDMEPRYKLARQRRRRRRWGDMFTLTRPNGREPFYFDHSTTFFPLELRPPPDVDFIPFELYAALGVFVGWQWMVDQFVRQSFVTERSAESALEVFLLDYRLLGVSPAAGLQGAVAHYPSEEHRQRILQYLAARGRAKARMRVELLDKSGQTVSEVWVDYAILRRH